MRMKITPENRRLLEALSFIDDSIVSDMLAEIKVPDAPSSERNKKVTRRSLRYFLTLAACLMLLIAAVPIITYFVPRIGIIFSGNAGAGSGTDEYDIPIPEGGLTFIEHVGEVPEEFKKIIEENLFRSAFVYGDHLLKHVSTEDEHIFRFFDKSGNITRQAVYPKSEKHLSINSKFLDSEDNLLVHFTVSYQDKANRPIHYAKIVKFDTDGNIVFDVDLAEGSGSFDFMTEVDDGYIFPGEIDVKTQTVKKGDVYVVKLTFDGKIQNTVTIGTADEFDTVCNVEKGENGAVLYICLQETKEGDQKSVWNYYRYDIKKDLTIKNITPITENDVPERGPFYFVDGKGLYSVEEFIADVDNLDYSPSELIDYGDFVLSVGNRYTSDYDFLKDGLSSVLQIKSFYTETVYAAYTKQGELIWRTAVDSTNYEMIKELLEEQQDN